ncbi:MAG TPA: zinc-binding alcohol dehydrogenase family protein [Tepidisphaeraceae bacterium]|jgi:NADPH:quinone reductase-like Zn-dependent oxidoreductase|nr:zinc-binding alcohol dehydrogenase family protein [Tepidisphaeraceae bacterium]
MRAVVIREFGEPKLLKVEEVPMPRAGEGEAVVEVKAAGINPSDVKNVQGAMHGTTLPRIPGRDFAGVVVSGPRDVVGREVWGTGGDIGYTRDGSHAQYIVVPVAALVPKPAKLSMDAAGSAGLIFVTAWSALVSAAGVSRGDWVLVVGASGGVGSAAVQIAKERGAKVIGAVREEKDSGRARENGADETIDTGSRNWVEAVQAMTDGGGADVVFDTSGLMFAQSVEAAAHGGRISVISAPTDGKAMFNLRSVYRKELRVRGVDTRPMDVVASGKLLAEMRGGFESGKFRVTLGEARALAEAVQAYELAGSGKGRFYLRPND